MDTSIKAIKDNIDFARCCLISIDWQRRITTAA